MWQLKPFAFRCLFESDERAFRFLHRRRPRRDPAGRRGGRHDREANAEARRSGDAGEVAGSSRSSGFSHYRKRGTHGHFVWLLMY